jgi:hypothetical protein
MLSTDPLTTEDLDQLSATAFDVEQPAALAAELVQAVEQGRIAQIADTGYALLLAAEIVERAASRDLPGADLDTALGLAQRAITAYRTHGNPEYNYPRAYRAGLLLRTGREDEAMAELGALRPLLTDDEDAVSYLSDVLSTNDRAALAEQWVSAALSTALHRRQALQPQRGTHAYKHCRDHGIHPGPNTASATPRSGPTPR